MNTLKKIIASTLAVISAASSVGIIANAEETNAVSISYETLAAAVTADNGTIIPAGSVAVTLNISDNTGFDSYITTLNINSAELIVDNNGAPIYSTGDILENALIASATSNGLVSFASASAENISSDGEMITFYVSSGFEGASIVNEQILSSAEVNEYAVSPASTLYSYYIGDTTQDNLINITDATEILSAVSIFNSTYKNNLSPNLTTKFAELHKNELLPKALVVEAADSDLDKIIDATDAQNVLQYYANIAACLDDPSVAHIGELVYIIK